MGHGRRRGRLVDMLCNSTNLTICAEILWVRNGNRKCSLAWTSQVDSIIYGHIAELGTSPLIIDLATKKDGDLLFDRILAQPTKSFRGTLRKANGMSLKKRVKNFILQNLSSNSLRFEAWSARNHTSYRK